MDEYKRKFVLARFPFTPTKWASNAVLILCATSCANSRTQETNCAAVPSLWRRRSVCVSIDGVQKYHFFPRFIHTHSCVQVIDLLKPDMPIDLILNLDPSADVATTPEADVAKPRPKCASLVERAVKAIELLTQYQQQARHESAREWAMYTRI